MRVQSVMFGFVVLNFANIAFSSDCMDENRPVMHPPIPRLVPARLQSISEYGPARSRPELRPVSPVIGLNGDERALFSAVEAGGFSVVRALLDNRVSPNCKDPARRHRTPLFFAGTKEMADLLVRYGADPAATDDDHHSPVLHMALSISPLEQLAAASARNGLR